MFRTRLISGIILVAAALAVIITGGWVLFFVMLALSLIGAFELYRALGLRKEGRLFSGMELAGYIGIVLYYLSLVIFRDAKFLGYHGDLSLAVLVITLILLCFVFVLGYPRFEASEVMKAFFGIVYVGVMLSFLYQTRQLIGGRLHVWLIFLAAWGCDTGAYCVGMLLGRHKMAPTLSPKKTIEGAAGGVGIAALLALIYALATKGPVPAYVIITIIGAVVSMFGDLAASAIKRNYGLKDYGRLIPGHGGVLDRFDSVIFTAPVVYFLTLILI